MKKCTIVTNGYCDYQSVKDQVFELKFELEERGVSVKTAYTRELLTYVAEGGEAESKLYGNDFIVYLDKDPYLSHLLEKCGYKLVNSAKAIEICDDKMKTHVALSGVVRMPATISSPLAYEPQKDDAFIDYVETVIPYPVVVKEVFGSMGRGVYLCPDKASLIKKRAELTGKPHLYQRFIGKGGEDVRVIVIGGKAVAAMKRRNDVDFRSNVAAGGRGTNIELTDEDRTLAETAAKTLALDYCGVDILHEDGKSYLCEVNSNAFWSGISKVTSINVAAMYAQYLVDKY